MKAFLSVIQHILFIKDFEPAHQKQFEIYQQRFQCRALFMANILAFFLLMGVLPFVFYEFELFTSIFTEQKLFISLLLALLIVIIGLTALFYQYQNRNDKIPFFHYYLYTNIFSLLLINYIAAEIFNPEYLNFFPMLFSIIYINVSMVLGQKFRLYLMASLSLVFIFGYIQQHPIFSPKYFLEATLLLQLMTFFLVIGQISYRLFKSSVAKHILRKENLLEVESQKSLIEQTFKKQQESLQTLYAALEIAESSEDFIQNPLKLSTYMHQLIENLEVSQKQQKKERKRFEDLFYNVSDGIMLRDHKWKVTHANAIIDEITGFGFSQGEYHNLNALIAHKDQAAYQEYLHCLESGRAAQFRGTLNTNRNQAKVNIELHSTPKMEHGKFVGSRDIMRRITIEQKQWQDILQRIENERALMLKMHDEIRNPLHVVQGFANLMDQTEDTSEKQSICHNIIQACASIQSYMDEFTEQISDGST